MKPIRIILIISLLFLLSNAYANKDRIEYPQIFKFIFEDNDTIILYSSSDSLLKFFADEIVNRRNHLIEVQMTFQSGETMTFKYNNYDLSSIKISTNTKEVLVPSETIAKINEIHFWTVALAWNQKDKSAFDPGYFYIQFNVGAEKSFDKFPYIQLYFCDMEFSKAIIWKQINYNSTQWSDL